MHIPQMSSQSLFFILLFVPLLFIPVQAIESGDANNEIITTVVTGKVVDIQNEPIHGATLLINGNTVGSSLIDGSFVMNDVPVNKAGIQVIAISDELAGRSSNIQFIQGENTDVGIIVINCIPPLCTADF